MKWQHFRLYIEAAPPALLPLPFCLEPSGEIQRSDQNESRGSQEKKEQETEDKKPAPLLWKRRRMVIPRLKKCEGFIHKAAPFLWAGLIGENRNG